MPIPSGVVLFAEYLVESRHGLTGGLRSRDSDARGFYFTGGPQGLVRRLGSTGRAVDAVGETVGIQYRIWYRRAPLLARVEVGPSDRTKTGVELTIGRRWRYVDDQFGVLEGTCRSREGGGLLRDVGLLVGHRALGCWGEVSLSRTTQRHPLLDRASLPFTATTRRPYRPDQDAAVVGMFPDALGGLQDVKTGALLSLRGALCGIDMLQVDCRRIEVLPFEGSKSLFECV